MDGRARAKIQRWEKAPLVSGAERRLRWLVRGEF